MTAMWGHGTTLAVESPEALASIGHLGWGKELQITPGKASWFHAPIPTPVFLPNSARAKLFRVFLLFKIQNHGDIRAVHIWDGPNKIWQSPNLSIKGSHLAIDNSNTFNLPTPKVVSAGVCISFLFQAAIGFDSDIGNARLHVAAFGGDFDQ